VHLLPGPTGLQLTIVTGRFSRKRFLVLENKLLEFPPAITVSASFYPVPVIAQELRTSVTERGKFSRIVYISPDEKLSTSHFHHYLI
jgi:hypothetical protein